MVASIGDDDLVLPAEADPVRRVEQLQAVAPGALAQLEPDVHTGHLLPERLDLGAGGRQQEGGGEDVAGDASLAHEAREPGVSCRKRKLRLY